MKRAQCPVCGMDASTSLLQIDGVGVSHHFCSAQCRDNFLARPTLYVGKPLGQSIKRRSFALGLVIDHVQVAHLKQVMQRVMGIYGLQVDALSYPV